MVGNGGEIAVMVIGEIAVMVKSRECDWETNFQIEILVGVFKFALDFGVFDFAKAGWLRPTTGHAQEIRESKTLAALRTFVPECSAAER